MEGIRFILCGNKKELKAVTEYLERKGIKYKIQKSVNLTDLIFEDGDSLGCGAVRVTTIWYAGTKTDQQVLCALTAGKEIF